MKLVYGINPIIELLKSPRVKITKLLIARGKKGKDVDYVIDFAKQEGIPVELAHQAVLDNLTGSDSNQGLVGYLPPFRYAGVDELIAERAGPLKNHLLLILDCITDPQNLGSLIRTAHCFGARGVILPRDRSAQVTAAAVKASAGTAFLTPVSLVTNLVKTIEYLKGKGFWIYGADACQGEDPGSIRLERGDDIALVVGSEGSGLRSLVKRHCDFFVSVPMSGKIDSLNVAVAAGIIMYEILRIWRGRDRL